MLRYDQAAMLVRVFLFFKLMGDYEYYTDWCICPVEGLQDLLNPKNNPCRVRLCNDRRAQKKLINFTPQAVRQD